MPGVLNETRSACCYCGVGCGVIIESDGARITGVRGDPDHPANFGQLCSKGSTLHLSATGDGRLLHPQLRRARGDERQRASWDDALQLAVERFATIIERDGADAVAFYGSGQLLTEDYYVFNKLARALVGTNNIDTNSRLCMSSAVMGYKATLGADAPPACYADIERAACIVMAGSNTAVAHPILFQRIEKARQADPGVKLIVIDPRRTDTAAVADLHLALLPGTDVALLNAMLHVMLWEGLTDHAFIRDHTSGFDEVRAAVAETTPGAVAGLCGLAVDDIVTAARLFARSPATLSLYCQGLNQSVQGTDKNIALINLHLATGQIGRPGAGPLSLTGQPNAMGGREVGGMATLLSGHRDLASAADRDEMARFWGIGSFPSQPGLTAVEMFEALRVRRVKAVWIACTNPAQSLPHQSRVREALQAAELVVVQDAFAATETAAYADVLLPAATWGEKDGTQTNSERCITRTRRAVVAPGEARNDWEIFADFGRRLGHRLGRADAPRLFPYTRPAQIFDEHRETTRGRDLDITGLDYERLEHTGPQQWPLPASATRGLERLYGDGRFATPDGRARFVAVRHRRLAESTDANYPLHLTTGRLRDQWHGMSRTGLVARLYAHTPEPVLSMHAEDMARRGVRTGDRVRVASRRGAISIGVEASNDLRPGQVFLPMHWGGAFVGGLGINALTTQAVDPVSRQPEYKHAAVRIEKLELAWSVVAMRAGNPGEMLPRLRSLLGEFSSANCGLAGRERSVVVFRAVCSAAPRDQVIARLDAALGLDDDGATMSYCDARRGISKRILLDGKRVVGARLCGENAAHRWLQELVASHADASSLRAWMLAPLATPPLGVAVRGRIVCSCLDVAADDIAAEIAAGADLAALQWRLRCGTQCGSCVPELKRMLSATKAVAI